MRQTVIKERRERWPEHVPWTRQWNINSLCNLRTPPGYISPEAFSSVKYLKYIFPRCCEYSSNFCNVLRSQHRAFLTPFDKGWVGASNYLMDPRFLKYATGRIFFLTILECKWTPQSAMFLIFPSDCAVDIIKIYAHAINNAPASSCLKQFPPAIFQRRISLAKLRNLSIVEHYAVL